jgi:hypothetical protein
VAWRATGDALLRLHACCVRNVHVQALRGELTALTTPPAMRADLLLRVLRMLFAYFVLNVFLFWLKNE